MTALHELELTPSFMHNDPTLITAQGAKLVDAHP